MYTKDEQVRMEMCGLLNSQAAGSEAEERARLEKAWGKIWDTEELTKDFIVRGFAAPYCIVVRKEDQMPGYLLFQHSPRFYFGFEAGERPRW